MNYSRRMASIYSPSMPRLCYLVAELIHRWEKLDMQSRRMSGSTSSQSKSDRGRDQNKDQTTLQRDQGGRGHVYFDNDKGTPCLITQLTCNCGGADINSTYYQCLVSMRNFTMFFTALTRVLIPRLSTGRYGGTVGAAAAWGYSCRRAPCQVQQT